MTDVVDAELVGGSPAVRCFQCKRTSNDAGMAGKQCGAGKPPCRGRLMPLPAARKPGSAPAVRTPPAAVIDHAPGQTVEILRGRIMQASTYDPDDQVSPETEEQYWRGVPENTQQAYTQQWARFVAWCGETGREHLPAKPGTVRDWIRAHWDMTDGRGKRRGRKEQPYAPDTVRLSLAVISVVHQAHELSNPARHVDVIRQMRGYARDWKAAGYRADVAHALTPEEMIAMVRTCDLGTCAGLRDAALIRLAYDIGRRNSEMMALNWVDLRWLSSERLIVRIPFSKTDKDVNEDGDEVAVEADVDLAPELCPLLLIREWLELCSNRKRADGAIFKLVNSGAPRKDGTHSGVIQAERMTRQAFQDVITRAARVSGVNIAPVSRTPRHIVPHSLRAGFATASEEAGVPIQATADRGGWSRESPVILRYWRSGKKWGDRNPAVIIRKATKRAAEEAAAAAAKEDQER